MTVTVIVQILVPILLGINAYFIKGLINSITEVRIKMEGMSHRNESLNGTVVEIKNDLKDIYLHVHKNRDRLHKLEGEAKQIENYLRDLLKR